MVYAMLGIFYKVGDLMLPRDEILESIDILVQHAVKETTQIYTALVTAVADSGNSCTIRVNGKSHSGIVYYGEAPTVNRSYRAFAPNGSMNQAFIITGGSGGLASLPIASATQLGGVKVGAGLTINDSGTLSATGGGTADSVDWKNVQDKPTTIGGYGITDAKISGNTIILGSGTMTPYTGSNPPPYPVTSVNGQTGDITIDTGGNVDSVNGKTGDVVLDASDVGALPSTTVIPSKTSQLTNDSGYVNLVQAKNAAPVQSVDGATGDVVTNAVKTTEQSLTNAQKQQARENIGAGISSFDGDYNSLSNKPTIPTKVSQLENDSDYATESQVNAKYTKPNSGIPKSDLSSDVQTSLDKANSALQSAPVTSVNNKTGAIQLTATDVGALPDTTVIPSKTSDLTNDSGYITDIPIASSTQLGGVKIGAGLTVSSEGTISVSGGGTADAVEWKNVLDKPTTIAGYGITDAKIDDGTIILGGQSITPLTEVPVTSVNGKTGAVNITADDVGALPSTTKIPTKTSDITNDSGFITDADIPVKSVNGQTGNVDLDKSDIGLNNVDNIKQYSASNPPPYPVTSVNGKTGDVVIDVSGGGTQVKIVRW